jgi:hypothetical protein
MDMLNVENTSSTLQTSMVDTKNGYMLNVEVFPISLTFCEGLSPIYQHTQHTHTTHTKSLWLTEKTMLKKTSTYNQHFQHLLVAMT